MGKSNCRQPGAGIVAEQRTADELRDKERVGDDDETRLIDGLAKIRSVQVMEQARFRGVLDTIADPRVRERLRAMWEDIALDPAPASMSRGRLA
ncbi:MAG: hypothetical protein H6729_05690 [Deltaproteobacteria bacterium]|nr:hypothetical protein [Deltaproteobacteria bacterium]